MNDELKVVRPATPALASGDVLVQLNSFALRGCADLDRALQEAADRGLIPALVVRREGALVTVTLQPALPLAAPATSTLPNGTPTALPVPTATGAPPTVPLASATAAPSPVVILPHPGGSAPFDQMVAALQAFSQQPPVLTSPPYEERLDGLRRQYASLRAEDASVAAAEPVLGYYETVGAILAYKDEHANDEGAGDTGQRVEGRRHQTDVAFSYGTDGPVPGWITRYGFLVPAIVRAPISNGSWEIEGRWLPDEAVRILLERANKETDALASGQATAPP